MKWLKIQNVGNVIITNNMKSITFKSETRNLKEKKKQKIHENVFGKYSKFRGKNIRGEYS